MEMTSANFPSRNIKYYYVRVIYVFDGYELLVDIFNNVSNSTQNVTLSERIRNSGTTSPC